MAFIRQFDKVEEVLQSDLFEKLLVDIRCGDPEQIVFPAIRDNTLDFYHGGGALFHFEGEEFRRNPAYDSETGIEEQTPVSKEKYGKSFLKNYGQFKKQNRDHFSSVVLEKGKRKTSKEKIKIKERQCLEHLYPHTYKGDSFPENSVCVLDIEIRLSNEEDEWKKCDLLLLDTRGEVWKIMFVEAKIYADSRMTCGTNNRTPEVVTQVQSYNELIADCSKETIEKQYEKHIRIMSKLIFGYEIYKKVELVEDAKLLVYETPTDEDIAKKNQYRCRRNLKQKLEEANIDTLWVGRGTPKEKLPTLEEIWDALYR